MKIALLAGDGIGPEILRDPETQCDWLREIGFRQVDTYFKLPGLAVFGGAKPKSPRGDG